MNPLLLGPLADLVRSVINKIWPDPVAQAEAQFKLAQLMQSGELAQLAANTDLVKAQIGVNATEAASTSFWVAGWRPYIGWVCGTAFAYKLLLAPLAALGLALAGHPITLPTLDTTEAMSLLTGMLGLGALRSLEKIKNVA